MTRRILPTGTRPPRTRMGDFSFLIYGKPGIGKTTLGNSFPKPIILATESGTELMEAAPVEIASWTDYLVIVKALGGGEDHDFRTVVLDTADSLYSLCLVHTCEQLGIADPADAEWGKGWRTLKTNWTNGIHQLRTLRNKEGERLCPVFISHEKTEEIKERRGRTVRATGRFYVSSDLPNSARGILHSSVDFIFRAEMTEEGDRILRTQPADTKTERIEAKGRGREGARLPDTLPMGFRELAGNFSRAFNPRTAQNTEK